MTRFIASALILLTLSACDFDRDYVEHAQDREACQRQPDLAWCSK